MSHRSLLVVVAVLAVAAGIGVAALWPSYARVAEAISSTSPDSELIDATVTDVESVGRIDQPGLPAGARSVVLTARLADTGETVIFPVVDTTGDLYQAGDRVRLERFDSTTEGGAPTYGVADFRRGPALVALAGLFGLAVLAFGRWQGARALLGLALTFAVVIGYLVPALLSGHSPLWAGLAGAVVIVIATLYLSHGVRPATTAAVVGTAGALAVTVALGAWFVDLASLTGLAQEEARLANLRIGGISLRGLLLAGIVIGALGVLDDVTMTQSSTVFALRRADPGFGFRRLVAEALRVGRDHVAATVNTLFLAYAGASLPLLLLFLTGSADAGQVLTGEVVAVEVVRTLVGSLGLIAAVPLTTVLAAAVVRGGDPAARSGDAERATSAAPEEPAPSRPAAGRADDPVGAALAAGPGDAAQDRADRGRARDAGDAEDARGPEDEDAEPEEWEQRLRRSYGLDDDRER